MSNLEILSKLYRVNAIVLQWARIDKPTGNWPTWAIEADMELTALERNFRLAAKAELQ